MSSQINPLDKGSVHRICSGQVVLTLGICVKELLENALDAGASRVEIGFMEYGLDLITLSDDGSGVEPGNYDGLALKHHTSKIRDFSDVSTVDTFGFRGEALSSLCALGHLSVITRTSSSQMGVELSYDHGGRLVSTKNTPRDKGTTVVIKDLFYTLPVRRAELKKHIKREFGKMLSVLTSYALISHQLRLFCWNNVKGKRTTVLQTHGRGELREALKDAFGSKNLKDLQEIDEDNGTIQMKGYISSVKHGEGRNAPDRQFLYLNHRPVDLNKIRRRINEAYKTYNRYQYPFIHLNILTDKKQVDINVTPDKRQIFIENETAIIKFIHQTLTTLFEDTPSVFDVTPLNESVFDKFELSFENQGSKRSLSESVSEEPLKKLKIQMEITRNQEETKLKDDTERLIATVVTEPPSVKKQTPLKPKVPLTPRVAHNAPIDEKVLSFLKKHAVDSITPEKYKDTQVSSPPKYVPIDKDQNIEAQISESSSIKSIKVDDSECSPVKPFEVKQPEQEVLTDHFCPPETSKRRSVTVDFDIAQLSSLSYSKGKSDSLQGRKFFAKICPEDNTTAEEELKKSIKKEAFKEMRILGQFNLGFIICLLDRDIFIVDQHATDEKYNFERLNKTCRLDGQVMVIPQSLELTYVSEVILSENMEIFNENGFEFEESSTVPGSQFKLKRVPMHRNWSFGKSDVEELIFMLEDYDKSSGQKVRPSKVKAMFASRACRTSVMIGTALSTRDMRRLIDHMSEMDHPWNCPHGRPTMRHLINLNMLK